ncbi:hypothetical protein PR048_025941 [Dryococelus australis]|uniref:Uncharacterized protein n=1 Tax=Dryococelus australis TaxID=614101 RepID=A0ABQ9GK02_9NEOP|nr:hypothetical protein PR048_025941 [Dryococelus australis]
MRWSLLSLLVLYRSELSHSFIHPLQLNSTPGPEACRNIYSVPLAIWKVQRTPSRAERTRTVTQSILQKTIHPGSAARVCNSAPVIDLPPPSLSYDSLFSSSLAGAGRAKQRVRNNIVPHQACIAGDQHVQDELSMVLDHPCNRDRGCHGRCVSPGFILLENRVVKLRQKRESTWSQNLLVVSPHRRGSSSLNQRDAGIVGNGTPCQETSCWGGVPLYDESGTVLHRQLICFNLKERTRLGNARETNDLNFARLPWHVFWRSGSEVQGHIASCRALTTWSGSRRGPPTRRRFVYSDGDREKSAVPNSNNTHAMIHLPPPPPSTKGSPELLPGQPRVCVCVCVYIRPRDLLHRGKPFLLFLSCCLVHAPEALEELCVNECTSTVPNVEESSNEKNNAVYQIGPEREHSLVLVLSQRERFLVVSVCRRECERARAQSTERARRQWRSRGEGSSGVSSVAGDKKTGHKGFLGWAGLQWLEFSPLTKAIRIQSPCRTMPLVGGEGFIGDLPFPPLFHSGVAQYSLQSPSSALKTSKLNAIPAYTRQKAKSKYRNRIRLERASQRRSSDTHKTPYDRVKRFRERKIYIKASERVNRERCWLHYHALAASYSSYAYGVQCFRRDAVLCKLDLQQRDFIARDENPQIKLRPYLRTFLLRLKRSQQRLRVRVPAGAAMMANGARAEGLPSSRTSGRRCVIAAPAERPLPLPLLRRGERDDDQQGLEDLPSTRRWRKDELVDSLADPRGIWTSRVVHAGRRTSACNVSWTCPSSSHDLQLRPRVQYATRQTRVVAGPVVCFSTFQSEFFEPLSDTRTLQLSLTPRTPAALASKMASLASIMQDTVGQSAPGNLARYPVAQPIGNLSQHAVSNQTEDPFPETRAAMVRLLASHQNESGSIPGLFTPRFSQLELVLDDSTDRRVFSGISRFPRPFIPALLHAHLTSPSSAFKTSMLRAAQNSPLTHFICVHLFTP